MDNNDTVTVPRREYERLIKKATALNFIFASYDEEKSYAITDTVKTLISAFADEVI